MQGREAELGRFPYIRFNKGKPYYGSTHTERERERAREKKSVRENESLPTIWVTVEQECVFLHVDKSAQ